MEGVIQLFFWNLLCISPKASPLSLRRREVLLLPPCTSPGNVGPCSAPPTPPRRKRRHPGHRQTASGPSLNNSGFALRGQGSF